MVEQNRLEGNIYIGKVQNVLLGMQAAFIDIGEEKNTFIHIRDVIPSVSNETGNKNEELSKHDIKNYIRQGMPILIQVKRDSTKRKGARVSTHINLSGRFVVIMPNTDFITISQKIDIVKEKQRLIEIVKKYLPKGYGAIVRTSAYGKNETTIQKDIQKLIEELKYIEQEFKKTNSQNFSPKLLHKNDGIVNKILIDVIDQNIEKIWVNQTDIRRYRKYTKSKNRTKTR